MCAWPSHAGIMTLTGGVQRLRPTLDPEELTISSKEMRQATSGRVDLPPHYTGKEERDTQTMAEPQRKDEPIATAEQSSAG